MKAEQLLDSKAFCAKLEALIKSNTETSRAETLQAVLDAAAGVPRETMNGPIPSHFPLELRREAAKVIGKNATDTFKKLTKRKRRTKAEMLAAKGAPLPKPTPKAPANEALQDMNSISAEERARIFDLPTDPPVPHKLNPEQQRQAHMEARAGKLEQLKPLLPDLAIGRKGFAILPSDFPVQDLPSYLAEIKGYVVTDKAPENLAMLSRQAKVGQDASSIPGFQGASKGYSGPKEGWKVELQRVP